MIGSAERREPKAGEIAIGKHIAVVVLNYNSEHDLMVSVPQLAAQEGIRISLIIVDNASHPDSVARILRWLSDWRPDAVVGSEATVRAWLNASAQIAANAGRIYLVANQENRGYSAGNNIGVRLAERMGADAVLIANPDMRVEDRGYVAVLATHLFSDDSHCVAASRILSLDGRDENPMREPTFWEEFFWPKRYLARLLKTRAVSEPLSLGREVYVQKVSGCCLMIKTDFLASADYLDERVFLYCEEPILSARVRKASGKIVYVPSALAVHAHQKSEKGDTGRRLLRFIESRKYYLQNYSEYSLPRVRLLMFSYGLMAIFARLRSVVGK